MERKKVTYAMGDGIGKEIMKVCMDVIKASNAPIDFEEIVVGEEIYLSGIKSGIPNDAWDKMSETGVLLKGPITTPQGGGYKSLNVTIRKTMGLFANVRPVKSFHPYIKTFFPGMDLVVIRENEEDLYAGIEHQQTPEVVQCLKLITRPGSEKIIRYAFEYAMAYGRKKVTCMTKDNIMKHTDGMFHDVFNEVAKEYPEIEAENYIIDIGSARLANSPERFDVIVTLNLYGDIISDITAEISGSVGLGGSANIGKEFAMFEAIHGSAPDIAGKNIANPSGLLHAACMMLMHINLPDEAELIQNALYKTIEDGIHTPDMKSDYTKETVGTRQFGDAIIARMGQHPEYLKVAKPTHHQIKIKEYDHPREEKLLTGVDVFIDWTGSDRDPNVLGKKLQELAKPEMALKMITNRGVKVFPEGRPETFCTDHWRCRFICESAFGKDPASLPKAEKAIDYQTIINLLSRLEKAGLNFIKIENLYELNGVRAYSLGQGE
jgi:isocitrate dehydrogenase